MIEASRHETIDIDDMTDEEYTEHMRKNGVEMVDLSKPSEALLALLVSDALRKEDGEEKAQGFIDIANICFALADRILGCQNPVARTVALTVH